MNRRTALAALAVAPTMPRLSEAAPVKPPTMWARYFKDRDSKVFLVTERKFDYEHFPYIGKKVGEVEVSPAVATLLRNGETWAYICRTLNSPNKIIIPKDGARAEITDLKVYRQARAT